MECSLPGVSVYGVFQAGILEWVAIPYPNMVYFQILELEVSWAVDVTTYLSGTPELEFIKTEGLICNIRHNS